MLALADVSPKITGHWHLAAFEGDIRRAQLTKAKQLENRYWSEQARQLADALFDQRVDALVDGAPRLARAIIRRRPHAFVEVPTVLPEGRHLGRILNRQVFEWEGENLVTTNGKGLLLDRLFALGTPPTQVNGIGVGNSATAAVVGDTQLLGSTPSPYLQAFDALPTRAGLVVTTVTTVATGNGNQNWQELGGFNGTTNGTSILFNRIAPIGPFNKTSALAIVVSMTLTQA